MNRTPHRRAAAILGIAAALALTFSGVTTASAESPISDKEKLAQEGTPAPSQDTGYASSLAEEAKFRSQALSEELSPGVYLAGDQVVSRIYADGKAPTDVTTTPSRFTAASLTALQDRLAGLAGKEGVFFGFGYRADSDTVVVTGNLPKSALPEAELRSGALTFEYTTEGGRETRTNDSAPHWGGARITSGGSGCSSGFIVKNSAGTRFAVTAAHCGSLNSTWTSGSYTFGKMTQRGPFPAYDMALLSGQSYGSYIWMGNSSGTGTQTGAAANPAVGSTYCTSGATTNENCGKKVNNLSDSFCDASGCTYSLASYTGGSNTSGGDSGGPLVLKSGSKVYPRGIHIARAGSTMYAEKWSTISSHFGVTAVTS